MGKKGFVITLGLAIFLLLVVIGIFIYVSNRATNTITSGFKGERALQDIRYQLSLGPRIPGSDAHQLIQKWLDSELSAYRWKVRIQAGSMLGHPIENIVAERGSGKRWIILGAHYDSRILADQDPHPLFRQQPVPGANDGASGVAVLVELARTLPIDLNANVWLVFFDAEDNGDIPGWDWLLGSKYFVSQLGCCPDAVVILDMIGDANLNIYEERNSNLALTGKIWRVAAQLGYSSKFIPQLKYAMIDDHTPFLEAGMAAIDIIDFDYPYWHTIEDTIDKVSADSLQVIGDTLLTWIKQP